MFLWWQNWRFSRSESPWAIWAYLKTALWEGVQTRPPAIPSDPVAFPKIPLCEGLLWHGDHKMKLCQHYLPQPLERDRKMKCSWLAFAISVWSMHLWRTNHRNLGRNRLLEGLNPISNLKQSCCWHQIMSTIHCLIGFWVPQKLKIQQLLLASYSRPAPPT